MTVQVLSIPASVYHRDDGAINASGLREFADGPARFQAIHLDHTLPRDPPSADMQVGSLTHTLVFEPDSARSEYAEFPQHLLGKNRDFNRRVIEEWTDQQAAGRVVLSSQQWRLAESMRDALLAHRDARAIIQAQGYTELSFYWPDPVTGVDQKARCDKLFLRAKENWLVDLKTTGRWLTDFNESIVKYGYLLQACHYVAAVEAWTGVRPRFFFLIVEKSPEHLVGIREVQPAELAAGEPYRRFLLDTYADCLRANIWPVSPISVPGPANSSQTEIADYQLPL